MSRLGYTFYPKDWRSNMKIVGLSLQEKGFYRELIDECFIKQSANITLNKRTFCAFHRLNSRSFARLLQKLEESLLIVCPNFDETLTEVNILIPSVSKRLKIKEVKTETLKKPPLIKENIKRIEDKDKLYSKNEFIESWNQLRTQHLKKPSFVKTLGGNEQETKFRELTRDYEKKDFEFAMIGLFKLYGTKEKV